jgi:hypothetical protein
MSGQNQPLQREEPKAQPYRAASLNAATQYGQLTAEPSHILAPKASTGTENGLPIPPFFEEPSRLNDEPPSKFHAGQSSRPKSLRPFIQSILAFKHGRKFSMTTSVHRKRRLSSAAEKEGQFSPALTVSYFSLLDQSFSILISTGASEAIPWYISGFLKRPNCTHCLSHQRWCLPHRLLRQAP